MILVLGSTGYVGNSLQKRLTSDGVDSIDPFPFNELQRNENLIKLRKASTLINATGTTSGSRSDLWRKNVDSLLRILNEVDPLNQRFIHFSSIHVSDNDKSDFYTQTKRESEKILLDYFSNALESLAIIQLPILWDNSMPKHGSLLDQLVKSKQNGIRLKLNYPDKHIQVCSTFSLFKKVQEIITTPCYGLHVPEVEWSGPVELLVNQLTVGVAPHRLQTVFNNLIDQS